MRHDDEILTDNTKIHYCKQCKDCVFRDDGTPYSSEYTKSSCQMFPYPDHKPMDVINNRGKCEYHLTKE